MSLGDEDRALNTILYSDVADVLALFAQDHFVNLFPARQAVAKFIKVYTDNNGDLPKHATVKRKFPDMFRKAERPDHLKHVVQVLTDDLVDSVVRSESEEMKDFHSKDDITSFLGKAQEMVDTVRRIQSPPDQAGLIAEDHNKRRIAEMKKDAKNAMKSISTGFPPMDDSLGGGASAGMLIVLAALINLGKTYMFCQIAENMRAQGHKVLLVPLEMDSKDIAERLLCLRYNLDVDQYIKKAQPQDSIDKGETREDWYTRILNERQDLIDADKCTGEVIVETGHGLVNTSHINTWARLHESDVILIDAAQDIQSAEKSKGRVEGLYLAIAELNSITRDTGAPIFLSVQLSAEVEKKGITTGNLVNIQWAQAFAQKAHAVYTMTGDRSTNLRDLSTDKNRDGQVGRKWQVEIQFPLVNVIGRYLQPTGVVMSAEDVFDDPAAAAAAAAQEMPAELSQAEQAVREMLDKITSPFEEEEEAEEEPPKKAYQEPEETPYTRKRAEQAAKRLRARMKRNK